MTATPTTAERTHYVKAREKGKRAWYFVTPRLGLNRLRIHASMFTREQAEQAAAEWAKQDDRYEFKAVPMAG